MVAESWFSNLWKTYKKHDLGAGKAQIGVLAFEVAGLMSKLVHLWRSLSDKELSKWREEIMNSVGIKKLVSDDDDYIVKLICGEIFENLLYVARAMARFSSRCADPLLKSFKIAFDDLIRNGVDPYGWQFSRKKMGRKAKKMERFIAANANLYQEMESIAELEQTLKRMKGDEDIDGLSWVEFEKKVAWKQQEVKHLKHISLWNRSYDYVVRLLARSIFTIFSRIVDVFGINHNIYTRKEDSTALNPEYIHHSRSISLSTQSSVHPSESNIWRFSLGPLVRDLTKSGPISRVKNPSQFFSGPLRNSRTRSSVSVRGNDINFYSGPLEKTTSKSVMMSRASKTSLKFWQVLHKLRTSQRERGHSETRKIKLIGPSKEHVLVGNSSVRHSQADSIGVHESLHPCVTSAFDSSYKPLNAPPETLGAASLALHYANVIVMIEKLATSPHLIGHDARDDLYNMLPARIRAALREKLKPYAKSLASSIFDTVLASEWNEAITGILEWLAPLAHNMIRWQSERSLEHQNFISRAHVFLVQTLYFANQDKTEATITELLVGLNYIWRFGRDLNAKALLACASGTTFDGSLELDD